MEQSQASSVKRFKLGWMLMILIKGSFGSSLIGCIQLLVCIVHFLLLHSPKEKLRPEMSKLFVESSLNSLQRLSGRQPKSHVSVLKPFTNLFLHRLVHKRIF